MRERVRSSYHWRWASRAFRGIWPIAGGGLPLGFAVMVGVVFAYTSPHPDTQDAWRAALDWLVPFLQATGLVLVVVFAALLILTPRKMAMRAQAEAKVREETLQAQVPAIDAALDAAVLSVRAFAEPQRIAGTGLTGSVCVIEYRNETVGALEGCAVTWEEMNTPFKSFGWTKVDWFARHRLGWDDTDQFEARLASGQARRVKLITAWPEGAVASVKLPGDRGDGWHLAGGAYQILLSVVADGYRARKETYEAYWSGNLSIDQRGDFLT